MMPADPQSPEQRFAERFATWEQLHRTQGPGRSYPYAWRLPELARPLGRVPLQQAQHALALDLYTLGRFEEALEALPEQGDEPASNPLRHRLNLLLAQAEPNQAQTCALPSAERDYCDYLLGRLLQGPGPNVVPHEETVPEAEWLWSTVLHAWSQAREGRGVALSASHLALASLRRLHPTLAAQAEAVFAETVYWQGPRWAPVWLDHALDLVDRYSQHHLKARLMGLKARALEAAGDLGEGARFRKQAKALAERQGARLYLRLFIDPA